MKSYPVTQRITHTKYGLGVIAESDADYTVIDFDEHGRKKFVTRIVTIETSDAPPPKRRRRKKKVVTTEKK